MSYECVKYASSHLTLSYVTLERCMSYVLIYVIRMRAYLTHSYVKYAYLCEICIFVSPHTLTCLWHTHICARHSRHSRCHLLCLIHVIRMCASYAKISMHVYTFARVPHARCHLMCLIYVIQMCQICIISHANISLHIYTFARITHVTQMSIAVSHMCHTNSSNMHHHTC